MLRSLATIAPSTATSRSASSKTMKGALPPSSIEERMTCVARLLQQLDPTAVEPVKEILRASPLLIQRSTTGPGSEEQTTLSTPVRQAGLLAGCSTSAKELSGVRCAGLNTMVQPAAIAGPILRVPMASGKFHGVTSTHGPTGCLVTMIRVLPSPLTVASPPMRTASSENQRKNSAA